MNNLQSEVYWSETERWLQRRHGEVLPGREHEERFRILGYQWRALRFNDDTRQSTVKVMAAYRESEPGSLCLMQQPHCLAVPCNFFHLLLCFVFFPQLYPVVLLGKEESCELVQVVLGLSS